MPARTPKKKKIGLPTDVAAIRKALKEFLDRKDDTGRVIGNAKHGVYAFYDYDKEPIYIGQTMEKLRGRIGRHLTNQRTDAVAMNVLDPFEVCEVEIWPIYPAAGEAVSQLLAKAEYAAYEKALRESPIGAVLNEKDIRQAAAYQLPPSYRARIIPDSLYEDRKHPDVRIARRASTIANLARVISERDVSPGLRRTLLTQARRLERLAKQRLADLDPNYPAEAPGEETGEEIA